MSNRTICRILNPATVLTAMVALALGGCSQSVKTSPSMVSVVLDGSQGHDSTRVAMGETLTVNLPTKVGALYAWRLTPETAENGQVKVLDRRQQINEKGELAFGDDPASDVFVFNAKKPGVTTLEFIYDCPPGCPQSMTSHVTVNVEVFDAKAEAMAQAKAQHEAEVAAAEAEQVRQTAAAAKAQKSAEIAAAEAQRISEIADISEAKHVASVDDSSN